MRLSAIFRNTQTLIRHCRTSIIKSLHTLHQSEPRQRTNRFSQTRKPQSKHKTLTQNVEPRVYTRDIVSNVHKILKYSTWDSAQEQLSNLSIKWDSYTVNQILKTHPPMQKSWLFFNWASRIKKFKHDHFTYTTMLDIFGEAGRISSMKFVFEEMKSKGAAVDAVTYTSLINWISRSGDLDGAVRLWEEMRGSGCDPTVVSYTAYMKVLIGGGRVKEASEVYREMIRAGVKPNCYTYTVLMEHLVGAGKCKDALDIFTKMQEARVKPDKAACNILIQKCSEAGETATMVHVLQYMKENQLVLRYPVFIEALKALKAAGESDALLREVNPHISVECVRNQISDECSTVSADHNHDDTTVSIDMGLIHILLKKQNLVAVDHLLLGMISKDMNLDSRIVSAIVEANCNRSRLEGALLAFDYSIKKRFFLNRTSYLSIIGNLIRLNTFPKVSEIVQELIDAGYSLGMYLSALLIYKLGSVKTRSAAEIFELLPHEEKGVAAYTAMINAFVSAGSPEKALKIFRDMQRAGIRPSLGTYRVMLYGLEKDGRVFEEAETLRKEKKAFVAGYHSRNDLSTDCKICDLFFASNVLL